MSAKKFMNALKFFGAFVLAFGLAISVIPSPSVSAQEWPPVPAPDVLNGGQINGSVELDGCRLGPVELNWEDPQQIEFGKSGSGVESMQRALGLLAVDANGNRVHPEVVKGCYGPETLGWVIYWKQNTMGYPAPHDGFISYCNLADMFDGYTAAATRCIDDNWWRADPDIADEAAEAAAQVARCDELKRKVVGCTDEVKRLQQMLADAGFSVGPVDGDFGGWTESAVRCYQQTHRLAVDGVVGPQTREAINDGLAGPPDCPSRQSSSSGGSDDDSPLDPVVTVIRAPFVLIGKFFGVHNPV